MNPASLPALAALTGSAIGALASFASTWLSQSAQLHSQRRAQSYARREKLYGDFINEAAKLFADASARELDDVAKIGTLYAMRSRMRLFAPPDVMEAADEAITRIVQMYNNENLTPRQVVNLDRASMDVLEQFTEFCRRDLTRQ